MPVQYSYTSTPSMDRTVCTDPQCLYSIAIPLLSLYGPYGLYRSSVPVQYSYTSTPPMGRTACTEPQCLYSIAIPLLPLCTVRPVQSLSAGTRMLFTLTFTFSPFVFDVFFRENKNNPQISRHFNNTTNVLYRTDHCVPEITQSI